LSREKKTLTGNKRKTLQWTVPEHGRSAAAQPRCYTPFQLEINESLGLYPSPLVAEVDIDGMTFFLNSSLVFYNRIWVLDFY
jgi:hypothetical protein